MVQPAGLLDHLGRNPSRKRDFLHDRAPRLRVDLSNSSQSFLRESVSNSHKGRPEAPVHKRHLSPDKPAHVDEIRVPDVTRQTMNGVCARMRPPTPFDALSRYFLNQARKRAVYRFENYSVCLDKLNCFLARHSD